MVDGLTGLTGLTTLTHTNRPEPEPAANHIHHVEDASATEPLVKPRIYQVSSYFTIQIFLLPYVCSIDADWVRQCTYDFWLVVWGYLLDISCNGLSSVLILCFSNDFDANIYKHHPAVNGRIILTYH